ncbi:MAG: hypothetical protein ABR505_06625 [Actinomycetota bacterium]
MNEEGDSSASPIDRLASALGFFASLDRRLASAFESLEEMRRQLRDLGSLGARGDDLMTDVQRRIETFDRRAHSDLDQLKAALLEKLDQVDVKGFEARLDRIEVTMSNIEKATVSLNTTMSASVEALPGFMTRKIKAEGQRVGTETSDGI